MRRIIACFLCIAVIMGMAACDTSNILRTEPTDPDMTGVPVNTVNSILVVGNTAYEFYNFRQDVADSYANVINAAQAKAPAGVNVYDILVPTAIDVVLARSVRDQVNTDDQLTAINYIYGNINDAVN